MLRIDSGRGLIEKTGFSGPVLVPKRGRGRTGKPIKRPGLNKGKRPKLSSCADRPDPDGPAKTARRFYQSYSHRLFSRLIGKPGFPTSSRLGVPDGMRRSEAEAAWRRARAMAVNSLIEMVKRGQI